MKKNAFTLLEIVIVIIIIGVLASLALPKLFSMIKYSYSAEALAHLSSYRRMLEVCYLQNRNYSGCADIDMDVKVGTGSHFEYGWDGAPPNAQKATVFAILPDESLKDPLKSLDRIYLIIVEPAKMTGICGTGIFTPIKDCTDLFAAYTAN